MHPRSRAVRDGYNQIADAYHASRAAREAVNVAWLDGLRARLPLTGRVLDLGCGAGVPITRYFAERGYDVTGVDISPAMLDLARANVPGAAFREAAIEDFLAEVEAGSYDLVVSFFAFIHVDRSLHAELFTAVAQALRPGGAFLASLGAGDNPDQREEDWHGGRMTWSHFDAATNLRLLAEAGFSIEWHEVEDLPGERHLFVIARSAAAAPSRVSCPGGFPGTR